jgi:hypothetical protein
MPRFFICRSADHEDDDILWSLNDYENGHHS